VPSEFPTTLRTAIALPHAMPLAIVNMTLGPGSKMIVVDETRNPARYEP
jgi:hypothetical protein